MDRIRAVTFDAFGTIVDTGREALIGISGRIVRDHLPGVPPEAFLEKWDVHFFGIDHDPFLTLAEATRVSLLQAFEEYRLDADPEPYAERLEREWRRARAYPEVAGVLQALDGVPRAVVSNADDAMLREILDRNRLEFDTIVTSESCRSYKPAPGIFETAMRALGTAPSDVLHVGDSLDADVAGAGRLGIATAWVNRAHERVRPGGPAPDLEVENLTGILPVFRRAP